MNLAPIVLVLQQALRVMMCERITHPRCPPLRLVVSVVDREVKKRSNGVAVQEESPVLKKRR